MIILTILIMILVGLLMYGFYKYGVLNKEHQKELDDHLDDIFEREKSKDKLKKTIDKKNAEIDESNNEILNLTKENADIREKLYITKRDLEKEINKLKESLSSTIKEDNLKIDNLTMQLEIKDKLLIKENKKVQNLENKLKEKEHQRRANASTIGAKQMKINNLEKKIVELKEIHKEELLKKDKTIEYLKSHRRAPSVEEVKAYDYQFKKVEQKIKNGE